MVGRRPQRRCLKETEGEGNKGSREKNEWVGSGKENRAFLRREQKQGDDLNALQITKLCIVMYYKYKVNVWKSGKDKEKKIRQPPEK